MTEIAKSAQKRAASEESCQTEETSEGDSVSPETRRIRKAEIAWNGGKPSKKLKVLSDDEGCLTVPNPGMKSSSLTDFLQFVCFKILNASELQVLKQLASRVSVMYYAEFCAGMATGTMALETPCWEYWTRCFF